MKTIQKLNILLISIIAMGTACSDFLEPSVDQEILAADAVGSLSDLVSVHAGIYDHMTPSGYMGRDFALHGDVSSDLATANDATNRFVQQRDFLYTVNSGIANSIWVFGYRAIANANLVINAEVPASPAANYTKGQAQALRALNHFNLLLAFGQQFVNGSDLGIPYVKTYAQGENTPTRLTVSETYTEIIADFTEAIALMEGASAPSDVLSGVTYMNPAAARALLSRVYLTQGDLANAITQADAVIGGRALATTLTDKDGFSAAWASGSGPNSLFELAYTSVDRLGINSVSNILLDTDYGDVQPTTEFINEHDLANDVRALLMTVDDTPVAELGFRMTGKYPVVQGDDNIRVVRLAEVYLNKAEALARQSANSAEALQIINDLNELRTGVANRYDGTNLLDQVLQERKLELAFEGHRLWDLLRNEKGVPIVSSTRTVAGFTTVLPFGEHRLALPIPLGEMTSNSNMVQNFGYEEQ